MPRLGEPVKDSSLLGLEIIDKTGGEVVAELLADSSIDVDRVRELVGKYNQEVEALEVTVFRTTEGILAFIKGVVNPADPRYYQPEPEGKNGDAGGENYVDVGSGGPAPT